MRIPLCTTILLLCLLCPLVVRAQTEYTVRPGDTAARIALWHGVSTRDLMRLNNIRDASRLPVGGALLIPDRLLGNARRKHVIVSGDTISSIARKYKVTQKALRELNRLSPGGILRPGRTLAIPNRPGDSGPSAEERKSQHRTPAAGRQFVEWAGGVKGLVISGEAVPNGVKHEVQPGQTLDMIARAYVVDATRLARQNNIPRNRPLTAETEIFIPEARRPVPVRTPEYTPHTVHFIRPRGAGQAKIRIENRSGKLNRDGVDALRRSLGYKWMHPRLAELFQRIAERFPGHTIELTSGYRKPVRGRKTQSGHTRGVAVDFLVQGVSNELLYELISAFDEVGAGYYPNSRHVHLDIRDKKFMWTDVSARGESVNYVSPEDERHWDNIKDTLDDLTE